MESQMSNSETRDLVAELEAQLSKAEGEARRPLRRKLRAAKRREAPGVPITRLSGTKTTGVATVPHRPRAPRVTREYVKTTSPKKLRKQLKKLGLKESEVATGGWVFPVGLHGEVLVAKFRARSASKNPQGFTFTQSEELVILFR